MVFAECLEHSSKPVFHSAKSSFPCATLGKSDTFVVVCKRSNHKYLITF